MLIRIGIYEVSRLDKISNGIQNQYYANLRNAYKSWKLTWPVLAADLETRAKEKYEQEHTEKLLVFESKCAAFEKQLETITDGVERTAIQDEWAKTEDALKDHKNGHLDSPSPLGLWFTENTGDDIYWCVFMAACSLAPTSRVSLRDVFDQREEGEVEAIASFFWQKLNDKNKSEEK